MAIEFANLTRVSRRLPQPTIADGEQIEMRANAYGDQIAGAVVATKHLLADEGSYLVATNPTPETLIAYGTGAATTQGAFSDTISFMVVKNNFVASDRNARTLFLDYLKIQIAGSVPATATSTQFAIKIDTKDRTPTSLSSLITPVNVNLGIDRVGAQVWCPAAGLTVVPASGASARLVSRGSLRQLISVTLEEYELRFGAVDGPGSMAAAGAGRFVTTAPPIILNPQEFAVIHLWQPSASGNNALSFEFELGMWAR